MSYIEAKNNVKIWY